LANELPAKNRTNGKPMPRRYRAGDGDGPPVGELETQTRLDRGLDDSHVIGRIDDDGVLGEGRGGRVILGHGWRSFERSILS
jgi:hypothetical protein